MTIHQDKAKRAIEKLIGQFEEAWNIHDAKSFSMIFAADADFTNVFGKSFHGRSAIETQHAGVFATILRASQLTVTEIRTRFIGTNLAAVDVAWSMSGALDMQGNAWPNRRGLLNLIMRNEDGSWAILIMHNKDLPAVS